MEERVDTRELELHILKSKADRAVERIDKVHADIKANKIPIKEAIKEFENIRKDLVDCATIQLGFSVAGPVACMTTIQTILSLDKLIISMQVLASLGA